MLRNAGLATLLLMAEVYIISTEDNITETLPNATGSQNGSEENVFFGLTISPSVAITELLREGSKSISTSMAVTVSIERSSSLPEYSKDRVFSPSTTSSVIIGSPSKSTPLQTHTSGSQPTDATSTSQAYSNATEFSNTSIVDFTFNGTVDLNKSATTHRTSVIKNTTEWTTVTSVQSTKSDSRTSDSTGSMNTSPSEPRTDVTSALQSTKGSTTALHSISTSHPTLSLTSSEITSVSQSTSASTQLTSAGMPLTVITTAQSTSTSVEQSSTADNQSTKATQSPSVTSTEPSITASTQTTAATIGKATAASVTTSTSSSSTAAPHLSHWPSSAIPDTTSKPITLSTQQTHREAQQREASLSTGSVVAISVVVIMVILVLIGGVMYFKVRNSSYGRLLDDQENGSWENYNNPLYDDS